MIEQKRQQETKAAIVLQAFWRGWFESSNYSYLKTCIVSAQSAFRRHIQYDRYRLMRGASIVVQAQFRSHRGRFNFHIHRGATIYLQRTWRQYRLIKEMKCAMSSRLVNFARMVITCQRFKRWKSAASTIQTSYRRACARSAFLEKREACTKLQAFWRQLRTGAYYCLLRILVIRSQSFFRRRIQQKAFTDSRKKIVLLQTFARWSCKRKRFLCIRQAVLTMQEHTRHWLEWKNLKATRIQAAIRRMREQVWYKRARSSALLVQRQWRMFANQSKYLQYQKKATVIQACVRRFFKRTRELEEYSATRLQSWYRCHITRFKFVIYQFSVVLAQSAWRSYRQKRVYQHTQKAVQLLQASFREKEKKKQMLQAKELIQRFLTGLVNRRRGLVLQAQKRRANKVEMVRIKRKERMKHLYDRESAAILIEYAYRKHCKNKLTDAAKVIQRWIRKRKLCLEQNQAALRIQCNWRQKVCERILLKKRKAVFLLVNTLRALFYGRLIRSQYCKARKSAILIQSTLRAFLCRTSYTTLRQNLIVIQAQSRVFLCRSSYARLQAAISIQKVLRSFLCRSSYKRICVRVAFLRERINHWNTIKTQSAIRVQREWRRHSSQTSYAVLRYAVVVLQSQWRSRCAQQHCQMQQCAAIRIQELWRSKQTRLWYERARAGLIHLQRRMKCICQQKAEAVILLQRHWRMWSTRSSYRRFVVTMALIRRRHDSLMTKRLVTRAAAIVQWQWRLFHGQRIMAASKIQKHWRQKRWTTAARQIQTKLRALQRRREFKLKRGAAVRIQSWFRSGIARLKLLIKVICATIVQSCYRGHRQRLLYSNASDSAILMAQAWRKTYLEVKFCRASTLIQNSWRRKLAQQSYQTLRQGCVLFQLAVHARHCIKVKMALTIQNSWRMQLAQRESEKRRRLLVVTRRRRSTLRYSKWRSGTIAQQKNAKHKHNSALLIQQVWRKKQHLLRSRSATVLASYARMLHLKSQYEKTRSKVVALQKWWRQLSTKQKWDHFSSEVKTLQAFCRMSVCRSKFNQTRCAAVLLQSHFRGYSTMTILQPRLLKRRHAAILVQSIWRVFAAKQAYRKFRKGMVALQVRFKPLFLDKVAAATCLQSFVRRILCEFNFEEALIATVLVQSHIRRYADQVRYQRLRFGLVTMQQAWRRRSMRRVKLVTWMQSFHRMTVYRCRFNKLKAAALVIESNWRASAARQSYQKCLQGIASMQARWKQVFLVKVEAATCLQAFARRFLCEFRFQGTLAATVLLQSSVRRHTARLKYQRYQHSIAAMQLNWKQLHLLRVKRATYLQSCVRMSRCKSRLGQTQSAVVLVQCHWRRARDHQTYQQCLRGMRKIQGKWRRCFALRESSATCIASYARAASCQRNFWQKKFGAIRIQSHWRRYTAFKKLQSFLGVVATLQNMWKSHFWQQSRRCTVLQSYMRMLSCRSKLLQRKSAAILIQSHFRRHAGHQRYQNFVSKLSKVQLHWKRCFLLKVSSAVCLQTHARVLICQKTLQGWQSAVIIVQAYVRRHAAQFQWQRYRNSLVSIQIQWKRFYVLKVKQATTLQSCLRMAHCISRLSQTRSAAILLQSHFRGYSGHQRYQNFISKLSKVQLHWKRCFLLKVSSALCLQTHARVLICQKTLQGWQSAVIILQAYIRRHAAHLQWQRYRISLVFIQMKWKRYYALKVKQATALQSCLRMAHCTFRFNQVRASAINVRCQWRRARDCSRYKKLLCGMIALQNRWKSYSLLKTLSPAQLQACALMVPSKSKHSFHFLWMDLRQSAALTAQKQWRKWVVWSTFHRIRRGFILLQAQCRMTCCSGKYKKLQVGFQRLHGLVKSQLAKKLKASLVLQTAVKVFLSKLALERRVNSATLLSSWYRGQSCRNKYLHFHSSVVLIQCKLCDQQHEALAPAVACYFPVTQRTKLKIILSAILMLPTFNPATNFDATLESSGVVSHPTVSNPLNFPEVSQGLENQSSVSHKADKVAGISGGAEAARPHFAFAVGTCDAASLDNTLQIPSEHTAEQAKARSSGAEPSLHFSLTSDICDAAPLSTTPQVPLRHTADQKKASSGSAEPASLCFSFAPETCNATSSHTAPTVPLKHIADQVYASSSSAEAARPCFSFVGDTCYATTSDTAPQIRDAALVVVERRPREDMKDQKRLDFHPGTNLPAPSPVKQSSGSEFVTAEDEAFQAHIQPIQNSFTTKSKPSATPAVLDLAYGTGEAWGNVHQVVAVICFMKYGLHGFVELMKRIRQVKFSSCHSRMFKPLQSFSGRLVLAPLEFFFLLMTLASGLTWSPTLFVSCLSLSPVCADGAHTFPSRSTSSSNNPGLLAEIQR